MAFNARHFQAGDGWSCGRHRRVQGRKSTDATTDPVMVNCFLCHRTRAYKAAAAKVAMEEEARHTSLRQAGLDPAKPVAEMTPEEILAYMATVGDVG